MQKVMEWSGLALALAIVVALAGCGGSGKSGVSKSKKISELSDTDIEKICQWAVPLLEEATCEESSGGDQASGSSGDATSTADPSGGEATRTEIDAEVADCIKDLKEDWSSCEATVRELEACVSAQVEDPCISESKQPACSFMKACGIDDETNNPVVDGGSNGTGDTWASCYLEGSSYDGESSCTFDWRCPDGADRKVTCEGNPGIVCTCRNVKEGIDEGTFDSADICTLESHNVAYRVNQGCGWQLPET